MKSINTLIKMNMRELDELRKSAVRMEEEKDRLINENNSLEDQLIREHALASSDPELGIIFKNFRVHVRAQQAEIVKSLINVDKKIEILKDEIAVKFGEVKKYEILLASKLLEEKKKQQALETKELDAIAVNNFLKEKADS